MQVITKNQTLQLPLLEATLKLCVQHFKFDSLFELPEIIEDLSVFDDYPDIEIMGGCPQEFEPTAANFPVINDFSICMENRILVFPENIRRIITYYHEGDEALTNDDIGFYALMATLHQIFRWLLSITTPEAGVTVEPRLFDTLEETLASYLTLSTISLSSNSLDRIYRHSGITAFDTASVLYSRMPYKFSIAEKLLPNFSESLNFQHQVIPLTSMLNTWVRRKQSNYPFVGITENRLRIDAISNVSLGQLYLLYTDWRDFFET